METASVPNASTVTRHGWWLAVALISLVLLGAGIAGRVSAAPGYALFAAATLLLVSGTVVFAVFALTRWGESLALQRTFTLLLSAGAAAYVLCVCALAGHYIHETLQGRMEWRWIVFGPSHSRRADCAGLRSLPESSSGTIFRPGAIQRYVSREQSNPVAMRRVLVDEVILHESLFRASKIRWLRHTLIMWGFVAMFVPSSSPSSFATAFRRLDGATSGVNPAIRSRLLFAFVYDFTACMIVVGCLLALGWRVAVNATPDRRYSDTPTTLFLLFVVLSGFVVEGLRILSTVTDPVHRAEFVGLAIAHLFERADVVTESAYEPWWYIHVIAASAFIAYVPVMRLIHTCATPLGRLANSQKEMMAARKKGVLGAMLRPAGPRQ
jgi:hypothetical protein